MDGNPIADARSEKLNRGIKIIQYQVIDEKFEIGAWLANTPQEYVNFPSDELVIHLSLSEQTAQLAKTLLVKWMTPEITLEEMQTFMDSVFDELED